MTDTCSRTDISRDATRRRRTLRWVIASLLAPGCVLDSDDRCGPNQVIWGDDRRCVCAEGTAYTPTGCVACGANEVGTAAGCVCAEGYARTGAGAPCVLCGENEQVSAAGCVCVAGYSRPSPGDACMELVGAGAGSECTADAECTDPTYPHCELRAGGDGYCTNTGCTTTADCSEGFACITAASPSVCRLPPEGAGRACDAPEDCADGEAPFCDTFVSFTCLVQDCTLEPDSCFPGTECCDVGFGLPTLCIAAGACQT